MADIESNIRIDIDATNAVAAIHNLQRQISAFHKDLRNSGNSVNQAISDNLSKNLVNAINSTKNFSASIENVKNETDAFTSALEKNKLSFGQYFRYGAAASGNFTKKFSKEFNSITKIAEERVKTLQTQYVALGKNANGAIESIKIRPLTLDMKNLGTQVAVNIQKQQLFNQIVKQGTTNLLNFGKNTQWAGRQLMVGFTIPLSMLGTTAVKSFMEMEKAVIKFRRVYGDLGTTVAETDAMVKNIQKMAREFTKYGVAVSDTMNMAAEAAAMGKVGAELTAQVAEASRLAVLGGVEQAQALETTTSLTNAFGIAAEDLASKIDFLNSVENQTVTSIEDLTIAIPKAAPVIQQLGGNVEDLAFFLTAMKEGGINASEGANALKSGLASMINPTAKASEFLQGFGINIAQIVQGNAGDVKSMVIGLASALDQLDPLNRAQAIEQLFGKFQFARISTLFQNVISEGSQASRVLDMTRASAQELAILSERELKKVEESPMFKFQKALEDFKTQLAPIGEEFLKLITPIVEFGGNLLKQFNGLEDGVKRFVMGSIAVLGLIAPAAIMSFGLIANGVANFLKGLNFVRLMFGKLAGAGTGLNQMTSYMTQEHLEATAVARSLADSHASLASAFTVEKGALEQLIATYRNAATEMQRYNAAAQNRARPGSGAPKPKKYADGVISVPGPKGRGDIIPAMLSPGEAIIPSDEAKKYAPLIRGIIADNIPGFQDGLLSDKGTDRRAPLRVSYDIANKNVPGSGDQVLRELEAAGVKITEARKIMRGIADLSIEGSESVKAAIANLKNGIESGLRGAKLTSDFRSKTGTGKPTGSGVAFAHIGDGATMTREELLAAAASGEMKVAPGKRSRIEAMAAGAKVPVKSGLGIGGINQTVNAQMAGKGAAMADFAKTFDEAGVEKWSQSIEFAGGDVKELSGDIQLLDNEMKRLIKQSKATKIFDTEAQRKQYEAQTGKKAESLQGLFGRARSSIKGTKLDDTLGVAAETVTEIRDTGTSPGAKGRRSLGRSKALRKAHQQEMFEAGVQDAKAYQRGSDSVTKGDPNSDQYPKSRKRNSPHKQAAKDGIDDAKAYGEASRKESKKQAKLSEKEDAKVAKQAAAQRRANRAGKVAGALGTATMVVGMATMAGGPVGDVANQIMPFVSGLSMVAPLLMALPAPIALVVGGLGLIAFGLYKMNESLVNARNEATKMAKAFSSGRDGMQNLAEFAGTVNPSETMDRVRAQNRASFEIVTGKNTFGAKYLESEAGQNLVSQAQASKIKSGGAAAAKDIAIQLAQAVATNILSTDQAASIASNLGEAIKDYDFAVDVNATMVELLGPGGEDLLKDPLVITARIIEEKQSTVAGTGGSKDLMSSGENGMWYNFLTPSKDRGNYTEVAAAEAEYAVFFEDLQQMGQQNLDKLDLEHQKRLDNLKAAGDLAGIEAENAKHAQDRAVLLKQNADAMKEEVDYIASLEANGENSMQYKSARQIVDNLEANQKALFEGLDEATKNAANLAIENIANEDDLSFANRAALVASISVENMDLFRQVQNTFPVKDNVEMWEKIAQVTLELGTGSEEDLLALLPNFTDNTKATQFVDYVVKVKAEAKDPAKGAAMATAAIDTMTALSKLENEVTDGTIDLGQFIDPDGNVTEKFTFIQNSLVSLEEKWAEMKGGSITYDVFFEVTGLSLSQQAQQYFNSLPADQQKTYTTAYLTMYESIDLNTAEGKARIAAWKAGKIAAGGGSANSTLANYYGTMSLSKAAGLMAEEAATQVTDNSKGITTTKASSPTTTKPAGGGGAKSDPYEALLTRLKRVRDASINAAGGLAELNKKMKDGSVIAKGLFKGTDQQLLQAGYSSEFVNEMMALDESQRKTFITITNGRVKVTKAGEQYQKALREAALGDYQLSLVQQVSNIGYQITAIEKLEEAGLSTADAMNIAADANLAYAISTGASTTEIQNMIDWMEKLRKKQFELDSGSVEGREKIVTSATSKVMEYFAAMEAQINSDFESGGNASGKNSAGYNIGAINAAIQQAQVSIEDYQYQVDDLQYVLDGIADKEEAINDKYDKRKDALEKVWELNKDISAEQKGQLDIANALTTGDIAAAARAVQAEQERRAQKAQDDQMKRLDAARESELGRVTGTNGKTRLEVEKEIKRINGEIAKIEEEKLEPATRNLDLATRARDAANDSVTYLGNAKTAWGNVETAARLAVVQSDAFGKSIRDTLSVLPGFKEVFDTAGNFTGYKFDPQAYKQWLTSGDGTSGNSNNNNNNSNNNDNNNNSNNNNSGANNDGKKTVVPTTTTYTVKSGDTLSAIAKKNGISLNTLLAANPKFTTNEKYKGGNMIWSGTTVKIPTKKKFGGMISRFQSGGLAFSKFVNGDYSMGSDTVPAMLTPGEFIVSKPAVDRFGLSNLKSINNGTYGSDSVYNYSVNVNVQSDADANEIARAVMTQIKQVDSKRIKGYGL